jgi:lysozyme family protein
MAAFAPALATVLAHEGGYVDHPADPGGSTRYGISLRFLEGLGAEGDIDLDGEVTAADVRGLTRERAAELYRRHWWERHGYERLRSDLIAAKVLDLAVNMGAKQAHRILQRALRAAGLPIVEDGVLGPMTLGAANATPELTLLVALRAEAAGFYRALAARDVSREVFLRGWLNRAYA